MKIMPFAAVFSLVTVPVFTKAQATAPPTTGSGSVSVFDTLFKHPTNNNGYEEFVLAGELIRDITETDVVLEPGTTLAAKKHAIQLPQCVRALELIKEGLQKPVVTPRPAVDSSTNFAEFAMFRKLARLYSTLEYVEFADGRPAVAVEVLRTALAFSFRIQVDSVLAGLVGAAMNAICIKSFAQHFDQLSIYDCDALVNVVRELLSYDSPAIAVLQSEKINVMRMLETTRSNRGDLLNLIQEGLQTSDPMTKRRIAELQALAQANSGDLNKVLNDAEAKIALEYDTAIANLRLLAPHRVQTPTDSSRGPGTTISAAVSIITENFISRMTTDQAKLKLLAVHALIQRYKWDHNLLPNSLSDLHSAEMVSDPFTDKPLLYKVEPDGRYTLKSAGPMSTVDTPGAPSGARTPIGIR